jgi:hypothetical protein
MIATPPVDKYPLKAVKAYADARKRVHLACTMIIMMVEFFAVTMIAVEIIHVILTATVAAWEALVITIGESEHGTPASA